MATLLRSGLRVNSAGQGLFRLIVRLGHTAYETAVLLTQFDFDIARAALAHGLKNRCTECATSRGTDSIRACSSCYALMRQRVQRLQQRLDEILGPAAPRTRHRRPMVMFGADREMAEGRSTLYDRSAAEEPEVSET